jgi:AraC-like DNA-binding protein/mannose-6-phosphate isomerase-like protein (cupin superfamily)
MDPLSHVFMGMHVKTSNSVQLEFQGSWGFRFHGYEHAHFGVIGRGACWLSVGGNDKPCPLTEGDCWLLPRGHQHILRERPASRVREYEEIRMNKKGGVVRHQEGEGPATTIIVGNFTFDGHSGKWLTDLLPELIAFRMDRGTSSAMQAILQILSLESQAESMGSVVVISRLADILFVQGVRAYAAQSGSGGTGWLRGIGDRKLSAALSAMHETISRQWTVASLASVAGMSRSGFAARFREVLGETPLDYLTRWRVHRASQLLREDDMKIMKVAGLVGYASEGAFSRVFKRATGIAPGKYKRSFL